MGIRLKRIYEPAADEDGHRVLVDRLWPRGVSKEHAKLDAWLKDIAPSDELRQWFGHDPDRWNAFVRRYAKELESVAQEPLDSLKNMARHRTVTLLYGARDREHNNAVALKEYLEGAISAD